MSPSASPASTPQSSPHRSAGSGDELQHRHSSENFYRRQKQQQRERSRSGERSRSEEWQRSQPEVIIEAGGGARTPSRSATPGDRPLWMHDSDDDDDEHHPSLLDGSEFDDDDNIETTRKGGYMNFEYPRSSAPSVLEAPVYPRYVSIHEPRLNDIRIEMERRKRLGQFSIDPQWMYSWRSAIYMLRVFAKNLLSVSVLLTNVLCASCTILWYYVGLGCDLPISIWSTAIIFPLSFGINAAYGRRDRVLLDIASLRSNVLDIYLLSRNWSRQKPNSDLPIHFRHLLIKNLQYMEQLFTHHGDRRVLFKIYRNFDRLHTLSELLRTSESWIPGLISRLYQYVRFLRLDFERIRTVYEFRTAAEVRAYASFGVGSISIIWSFYFANLAKTWGLGYALYAIIVSNTLLVCLFEIFCSLEDPFDGRGDDDLNFAWVFEVNNFMFEDIATTRPYHEQSRPVRPLRRVPHQSLSDSFAQFL